MPAIPEDLRLQAFAAAACKIEPADNKDDIEEALKVHQEESDDQLKEDLKLGFLTWQKLKPAEQYQGFLDETLHEDQPLVLMEHYFELRAKNLMPRLLAETLYEQWETAKNQQDMMTQQAAMMMQPAPEMLPLPERPPALWPLLLKCRSWVVEKVAAEYRRLDREQMKREGVT